jgi:hypothetical protein
LKHCVHAFTIQEIGIDWISIAVDPVKPSYCSTPTQNVASFTLTCTPHPIPFPTSTQHHHMPFHTTSDHLYRSDLASRIHDPRSHPSPSPLTDPHLSSSTNRSRDQYPPGIRALCIIASMQRFPSDSAYTSDLTSALDRISSPSHLCARLPLHLASAAGWILCTVCSRASERTLRGPIGEHTGTYRS